MSDEKAGVVQSHVLPCSAENSQESFPPALHRGLSLSDNQSSGRMESYVHVAADNNIGDPEMPDDLLDEDMKLYAHDSESACDKKMKQASKRKCEKKEDAASISKGGADKDGKGGWDEDDLSIDEVEAVEVKAKRRKSREEIRREKISIETKEDLFENRKEPKTAEEFEEDFEILMQIMKSNKKPKVDPLPKSREEIEKENEEVVEDVDVAAEVEEACDGEGSEETEKEVEMVVALETTDATHAEDDREEGKGEEEAADATDEAALEDDKKEEKGGEETAEDPPDIHNVIREHSEDAVAIVDQLEEKSGVEEEEEEEREEKEEMEEAKREEETEKEEEEAEEKREKEREKEKEKREEETEKKREEEREKQEEEYFLDEGKEEMDESDYEEELKKRRVTRSSSRKGATKKGKKKDVPLTEEEVIAEIGRKKEESIEKAIKMKEKKKEEKERKRVEMEKKKEMTERKKEEKKREKEMDMKEMEEWKNLVKIAPRTRAQAARRTKALIKLGKRVMGELMDEDEGRKSKKRGKCEEDIEESDDEEEKMKTKKRRKSVRYTPAAPSRKRVKKDAEEKEEEHNEDCGNFIENPNDIRGLEYSQSMPDSEYEEEEGDDELSLPFLWRSDKENEMMIDGVMGPANFDPDEALKRRLNELTEFSEGITAEYREMTEKLDGIKLNLYTDSTVRKFDPRVVHTIYSAATVGMWPVGGLPKPGANIPTMESQVWSRHGGENGKNIPFRRSGKPWIFKPFIRVRPDFITTDQRASKEIDKLSHGEVNTVTEEDIMENLEELLMSKLDSTKSWTPLPSAHNPFDIPEITTRKKLTEPRVYEEPASYVHKIPVVELPRNRVNKKNNTNKKNIKQALIDFVRKPATAKDVPEDIYKDDKEEEGDKDGYQFEWNEMGEMIDNPMKDNLVGEDPFGAHPNKSMTTGVEEGEVAVAGDDESAIVKTPATSNNEKEGETQIGEAFSFMANHLGA